MVSRKYREPKNYERGGAVLADTDIAGDGPTTPAPAPAHDDGGNALLQAVEATWHAEQLQREAEQVQREQQQTSRAPTELSFEDRLSGMQVPETAKAWLRTHPELLTDADKNERLGISHQHAIKVARLEPFSSAYFDAIEQSLGMRSTTQETRAEPAMPTVRRSGPNGSIQAPVSREPMTMSSGHRQSQNDSVTLSQEELVMAHLSYRDMPKAKAEKLYAEQKLRLQRLRQSGQYPESGQG